MASNQTMDTTPTDGAMASGEVMEVMVYHRADETFVVVKSFRNMYVTTKKCSPEAANPITADEKDRRLRQLSDDVSWMLSGQIKLTHSLHPKQREGIETIFGIALDPNSHLPDSLKHRILELQKKWQGINWDEDSDDEDHDDSDDEDHDDSHRNPTGNRVTTVKTRPPPKTHRIYGVEGIMHGVVCGRGIKRQMVYTLNPRVEHKNAGVFGDNGLAVGAWWPLQIVALHHGAHGARVAGIAGDANAGAYSIVVAASYDDLDRDEGDTIYYSAANSHQNTDKTRPPQATNSTKALAASCTNHRDVRVLRSGGSSSFSAGKRPWFAPAAGIRYDGLYQVVSRRVATNAKGK